MVIQTSQLDRKLYNAFKGRKKGTPDFYKLRDFANELNTSPPKSETRFINQFKGLTEFGMLRLFRNLPIENKYIGDFVDLNRQIIIEVDGSIHELESVQKKDVKREIYLRKRGWFIIRLKTSQSAEEWYHVMKTGIERAISTFHRRKTTKRRRAAYNAFVMSNRVLTKRHAGNSDDQNKAPVTVLEYYKS